MITYTSSSGYESQIDKTVEKHPHFHSSGTTITRDIDESTIEAFKSYQELKELMIREQEINKIIQSKSEKENRFFPSFVKLELSVLLILSIFALFISAFSNFSGNFPMFIYLFIFSTGSFALFFSLLYLSKTVI